MKEKFIFTDDRNDLWEDRDRLTTCIDGVRNVGDDREALSITVIIRTNATAGVVCKLYRNGDLIKASEEYSDDAKELGKRVKEYIGDLEE